MWIETAKMVLLIGAMLMLASVMAWVEWRATNIALNDIYHPVPAIHNVMVRRQLNSVRLTVLVAWLCGMGTSAIGEVIWYWL